MSLEEHYRKLENMYNGAPTNAYYAPRLTIEKGRAEWIADIREEWFHAASAVHGSVYFKALDDACFFAANSLVSNVFVLTVSFHIHLLRPANKGKLRAEGRVIQNSPNLIVAEGILYNDKGKETARGSGNFAKSKIPLEGVPGYEL